MKHTLRKSMIRIRGNRFYNCEKLIKSGMLKEGDAVILLPEPDNIHDSNAVAILTAKTEMLGHISKEIAGKYQEICNSGFIRDAIISSIRETGDITKYDIRVSITYLSDKNFDFDEISKEAGAYEISLNSGYFYIGATGNLQRRRGQHLSNLLNKSHTNAALQIDFNAKGIANFHFNVLKKTNNLAEAENFESAEIQRRLKKSENLYNKTADGRGYLRGGNKSTATVSDIDWIIWAETNTKKGYSTANKNDDVIKKITEVKSNRDIEMNESEKNTLSKISDITSQIMSLEKEKMGIDEKIIELKDLLYKVSVDELEDREKVVTKRDNNKSRRPKNNKNKATLKSTNCRGCGKSVSVDVKDTKSQHLQCVYCYYKNDNPCYKFPRTRNKPVVDDLENSKPLSSNISVPRVSSSRHDRFKRWLCKYCSKENQSLDESHTLKCDYCKKHNVGIPW